MLAHIGLALVFSLVCVYGSDQIRPIPMTEGRPYKESNYGDTTKQPLQPILNKSTVRFIKEVLEPEMAPANWKPMDIPKVVENATLPSPVPQPQVPLAKLVDAFERYDIDQSGKLELAEAKSIFDEFHIHFNSMEELNSYFDRNGFMSYDSFCDLLRDKDVSRADEVEIAKEAFCRSLNLDVKYLQNRTKFHLQADAVIWIRRELRKSNIQGPFPIPTAPLFMNQEEVEIAKAAIIEWRVKDTGRTDPVTYDNVHLNKEAADEMVHNQRYLCHPALSETCSLQSPCCDGLVCCPTQSNTGVITSYCVAKC